MRRLWPPSKKRPEGVELAGLEPATSWIRYATWTEREVARSSSGKGEPCLDRTA